jgi:hypothetical protein
MSVLSGSVHSPAIARKFKGMASQRLSRNTVFDFTSDVPEPAWIGNGADNGVFYAAQETVVISGTIRENILFGAPYSPDLFSSVVDVCALDTEIASMPNGDNTQVPFGGAT